MNNQVVNFIKQHKILVISAVIAIVVIITSLVITINLTNKKNKKQETNATFLKESLEDLGAKY